jgi:hypothetical protein
MTAEEELLEIWSLWTSSSSRLGMTQPQRAKIFEEVKGEKNSRDTPEDGTDRG